MWTCGLCGQKNKDEATSCPTCLARKTDEQLDPSSLFITHATSLSAYENIQKTGFEIRKEPTAGRSLGDVIYGYVYDGESLLGSLGHAVGVCREKKQDDLAIFRIAPNEGACKLLILNQPAWEHILDHDQDKSNYEAYLEAHAHDEGMKEVIKLARQMRLQQITKEPYSYTERLLSEKEAEYQARVNAVLKLKSEEASQQRTNMAAWFKEFEKINAERSRLSEKITEDHLALAAQALGYNGIYNVKTRIIVFFDPRTVESKDLLIAAQVPEELKQEGTPHEEREEATKKLLELADPEGSMAHNIFFEKEREKEEPPMVSSLKLPPKLIGHGSLIKMTQECPLPKKSALPASEEKGKEKEEEGEEKEEEGEEAPTTVDGMRIVPIKDDGHCMFRAVALHTDWAESIESLRVRVASFLTTTYRGQQLVLMHDEQGRSPQAYAKAVRNMKKDILWGGEIELAVMAHLLGRPIVVHRFDGPPRGYEGLEGDNPAGDPIHILHRTRGDIGDSANHYDALREK